MKILCALVLCLGGRHRRRGEPDAIVGTGRRDKDGNRDSIVEIAKRGRVLGTCVGEVRGLSQDD